MSLENGRCPSCNGALILDDSKEKAVCKYCGNEIIILQALQKCTIDGIAGFDTKMLSAQRALELDEDFDKAQKLYREALELRPDDYKALWGLYLCEVASIDHAKHFKGYVMQPGDIIPYYNEISRKYGDRAYRGAPDDVKLYYDKILKDNRAKFSEAPEKTKSGGCYVATCVYGSYDCPQVWTLRRYRDDRLGATRQGRMFIRIYYAVSPIVVKLLGKTEWFRKFWKKKLDVMVEKLQQEGFESTPYCDKEW